MVHGHVLSTGYIWTVRPHNVKVWRSSFYVWKIPGIPLFKSCINMECNFRKYCCLSYYKNTCRIQVYLFRICIIIILCNTTKYWLKTIPAKKILLMKSKNVAMYVNINRITTCVIRKVMNYKHRQCNLMLKCVLLS